MVASDFLISITCSRAQRSVLVNKNFPAAQMNKPFHKNQTDRTQTRSCTTTLHNKPFLFINLMSAKVYSRETPFLKAVRHLFIYIYPNPDRKVMRYTVNDAFGD